jgi:hypothetical protein
MQNDFVRGMLTGTVKGKIKIGLDHGPDTLVQGCNLL